MTVIVAIAAGSFHTLALATTRSVSTTYGYDHLYRLTTGGVPGSPTSYTYDPVGNRLTQTKGTVSTAYTYDKADRLLTVGGASYTVDANGNLTVGASSGLGATTYAYDQANRLTSGALGASNLFTSTYDGDGKRTKKVVSGTTTTYVYDANRPLPVVLIDGTLKYVYGLGLAYAVDSSGNTQTYHTDGLGSVRAITNGTGNVTQTFQTDEFGVPALTQGTNTEPFRFTGQQSDSESGFYDLRARYYSPSLGRFIGRDPVFGAVSNPLSLNRFAYALDGPATLADPSGLSNTSSDSPPRSAGSRTKTDNACFTTDGGLFKGYLVNPACFIFQPQGQIQVVIWMPTPFGDVMLPTIFFAQTPGSGSASGADDGQETVARLARPPLPGGVRTLGEFGRLIMKWGTGDAAARARIGTVTREEMESSGVTREIADAWRGFYQNEAKRVPGNPSAAGRADLMQYVSKLLGGGQ